MVNFNSEHPFTTYTLEKFPPQPEEELEALEERKQLKSQRTTPEKIARIESKINRLLQAPSRVAWCSTETAFPVMIQTQAKLEKYIGNLKEIKTDYKKRLEETKKELKNIKSLRERSQEKLDDIKDQVWELRRKQTATELKRQSKDPTKSYDQKSKEALIFLKQHSLNSMENTATSSSVPKSLS